MSRDNFVSITTRSLLTQRLAFAHAFVQDVNPLEALGAVKCAPAQELPSTTDFVVNMIMHEQGIRMGRIGTRRLPAHLDALEARSDERLERVGNWHDSQYREAYVLIVEAFPEAEGTKSMGEISHAGTV